MTNDLSRAIDVTAGLLERAQEEWEAERARLTQEAYAFLDKSFSDILGRRFGVGWGNRLERQMIDFVPVVLAAGRRASPCS